MATFADLKTKTDVLVDNPAMTNLLGGFINQGVTKLLVAFHRYWMALIIHFRIR